MRFIIGAEVMTIGDSANGIGIDTVAAEVLAYG
jgi:hypothetical protein